MKEKPTAKAKGHAKSAPVTEVVEHSQGEAHASGIKAVLGNEYTWIGAAFLITVVLIVKYLMPMINRGLDQRAEKIRDQLEQASRLRAEAEALLATYQAEQAQKLKEAEEIVAVAKRDAEAMRAQAASDLKHYLDRRTQQAEEKVARAEAEAVSKIRARIVDLATEKAREQLAGQQAPVTERDVSQVIEAFQARAV